LNYVEGHTKSSETMSLGPAGASLDPEQAENFEDVSYIMDLGQHSLMLNLDIDGKAVRC